jgi:hypothetical protein
VERDLRRYLECGILAYGFARAHCDECGHDFLIAFSCKGRGICPSCNTRRMAETAAHLVDHVIPPVSVRQWVLSLPKRLRWHLHRDPALRIAVLRLFLRAVEQTLLTHSETAPAGARMGAVSFIHRFGAALNPHTHYHCCVTDGIFSADASSVHFHTSRLNTADIQQVQETVRQRTLRLFQRRGLLTHDEVEAMLDWSHGGGFSVDASVRIAADDRRGLERLLRYCARPVFAQERPAWAWGGGRPGGRGVRPPRPGAPGRRPRSGPLRDRVRSTGELVAIPLTARMLSGFTARQSLCRVACKISLRYHPSHATQGPSERLLRIPTQQFF